jgi:hypothetical protein
MKHGSVEVPAFKVSFKETNGMSRTIELGTRQQAARRLAIELKATIDNDTVVIGISRGGIICRIGTARSRL